MAQSSFGYMNTEPSGTNVPLTKLSLVTDYAIVADKANEVVLVNTTTPIDQTEIITLRSSVIPKVNTSSSLPVVNKAPNSTGISYTVQTEATQRTVSDDGTLVDEPLVMYTVIRHPRSGNITAQTVEDMLKRHLSVFFTDGGKCRLNELMRSALQPKMD